MARIKVPCPTCRTVDIRSAFVTLLRLEGSTTPWAYRYRCPRCAQLVFTPITWAGPWNQLLAAGCKVHTIGRPDELDQRGDGPALTDDDAIDLHQALADDTALAAWLNPELPNEGTAP
jgi:hypothetical protein